MHNYSYIFEQSSWSVRKRVGIAQWLQIQAQDWKNMWFYLFFLTNISLLKHTHAHINTYIYSYVYIYIHVSRGTQKKKTKQNEEEVVNFDVCLGDKVLPVSIVNNQSPLLSTVFIVEVIMMMS